VLLFLLFLALYVRTAAPSVLSGDSAEFQMAAPLLGVPHPTTYPLYVLLGKLATLVIPFGDLAWRVTIVSSVCAALAVALFFGIARRLTVSVPAALVGALALGLAPGLWNAATMAEVYALLLALLLALFYLIVMDEGRGTNDDRRRTKDEGRRTKDEGRMTTDEGRPTKDEGLLPIRNSPLRCACPPSPISHLPFLAAFVGGLGFAHHGLFVIAGLPILAVYLLWSLFQLLDEGRRTKDERWFFRPSSFVLRLGLKQLALLALCFAAGLLPWLYPLAQYARYGPFTGQDYGLPQHYFWGAPASWAQALDLLIGGPMRGSIFRAPTLDSVMAVLRLVGQRLLFEFGPIGVPLGLLGSIVLLRRARIAWLGAAWIFFATLAYLLLIGPAVQDAPVFTLPMLLPWALWIAAGSAALIEWAEDRGWGLGAGGQAQRRGELRTKDEGRRTKDGAQLNTALSSLVVRLSSAFVFRRSSFVVLLLVASTLAWGYTRLHVSSKRQLWLFRRFGEATLDQLPPGAAVITHWEQGMTLQYLIRVEGRRPDVWVDVVEPSDVSWRDRARRYDDRTVFFVGAPADVADLPVMLVHEYEYADVFELRR
jgi:transmembrane protein TMEM260 (protein O-mannosyltransferase)